MRRSVDLIGGDVVVNRVVDIVGKRVCGGVGAGVRAGTSLVLIISALIWSLSS